MATLDKKAVSFSTLNAPQRKVTDSGFNPKSREMSSTQKAGCVPPIRRRTCWQRRLCLCPHPGPGRARAARAKNSSAHHPVRLSIAFSGPNCHTQHASGLRESQRTTRGPPRRWGKGTWPVSQEYVLLALPCDLRSGRLGTRFLIYEPGHHLCTAIRAVTLHANSSPSQQSQVHFKCQHNSLRSLDSRCF